MIIHDDKTLKQIQDEFSEKFPFLKIEFYKFPHEESGYSNVKDQINTNKKIADIRLVHNTENISIKKDMTVNDFELMFNNKLSLNVQVFRKSGNIWLQTGATDYLTLAEQNRRGEESLTMV